MGWKHTIMMGVLRNGTRVGVRSPTLVVMVVPPATLEDGRAEVMRRIVKEVVAPLAQLVGGSSAMKAAARRYVLRARGAGRAGHYKVLAEPTAPMITMELAEVDELIRKALEEAHETVKGSA